MDSEENSVDCKSKALLSGAAAEKLACEYMLDQGLTLVGRNFRTRRGEIDLIMQDNKDLVFIEVRFRKSIRFGSAEESITRQKCARLTAAALAYMQYQHLGENTVVRFDAVAISPESNNQSDFKLNWIKNILA
jgi:putative endonuclease